MAVQQAIDQKLRALDFLWVQDHPPLAKQLEEAVVTPHASRAKLVELRVDMIRRDFLTQPFHDVGARTCFRLEARLGMGGIHGHGRGREHGHLQGTRPNNTCIAPDPQTCRTTHAYDSISVHVLQALASRHSHESHSTKSAFTQVLLGFREGWPSKCR